MPGGIKYTASHSSVITILYKMKDQLPGCIIYSTRYSSKTEMKH